MVTVSAGARLHVGFQNLSLAHDRLYGGIGLGLAEPRVAIRAEPAATVRADDADVERHAERAVEVLDVDGVDATATERFSRHVGLGSGTQLALATYLATAVANDVTPRPRTHAPAMGRGGRSGVGVAAFEAGGFVVDAGHPTSRFTSEPPARGEWTVPPVVARHELPSEWRFLVVLPDAPDGRSGASEDESVRSVVERADPALADEVAGLLCRRLLPAAAAGRLDAFGAAVEAIGRRNGAWYADEQGGVFRPPAGELVDELGACPVLSGVGQSSWGPTVYGVTTAEHAVEARAAAEGALTACELDGSVSLCEPDGHGATVTDTDRRNRGWAGRERDGEDPVGRTNGDGGCHNR